MRAPDGIKGRRMWRNLCEYMLGLYTAVLGLGNLKYI